MEGGQHHPLWWLSPHSHPPYAQDSVNTKPWLVGIRARPRASGHSVSIAHREPTVCVCITEMTLHCTLVVGPFTLLCWPTAQYPA
jgi:hypothetical protein